VRRVRDKGPAEVVVLPVGRSVQERGPLFTLWIDPTPNPAGRNWVGWSPAGFYEANSRASEGRIGWLTATGDPAQPVTLAGVGQYRRLFYRRAILGLLAEEADLNAALRRVVPPDPPKLVVEVTPLETPDGLKLVRTKTAQLRVTLSDPDDVLWLQRAFVFWQATGPEGRPGPRHKVAVVDGTVAPIDLTDYPWARGPHRFHVALHLTPESAPVLEDAAAVVYLPPRPDIAVRVDDQNVENTGTFPTTKKTVRVVTSIKAVSDVDVRLASTGPGGLTNKELAESKTVKGEYDPIDVPLDPGDRRTVIKLTAVPRGAKEFKEFERYESEEFKVYVEHDDLQVRLRLVTPHAPPARSDRPSVVESPEVAFEAAVTSKHPVTAFEWDLGDGKWVPGQLAGATRTEARKVVLPADGKRRMVKVRAVSQTKLERAESVEVVYSRLPRVAITGLPAAVTGPDLPMTGTFADAFPALPARVKVVVRSDVVGQSREVPVTLDAATGTWKLAEDASLFPGKNRVGLVVENDYQERREPDLADVTYRRPPVVVGARPVDAGTAAVGDLTATVATARDMGPDRLLVNGGPVDARTPRRVGSLFGLVFWEVRADAVPVRVGDAWLNHVHVVVHNADGESGAVAVEVRHKQLVPVLAPAISVTRGPDRIQNGQSIATNQPRFGFNLRVTSGTALGRVELWHQAGPQAPLERVDGVGPRDALAVPDGFDLHSAPEIELRDGVNRVRVVAANTGTGDSLEFTVTYTPPPVRVVIEGIDEVGAAGAPPVELGAPGRGRQVVADRAFVQVRGKVVWTADDAPVARARDLSVVLTANQVVHFPAELRPAEGAKKERSFTAPLFLNAAQTRVTVEVRVWGRPPVAQQGVGPAGFDLACRGPLAEQRLHVVVIAPDVSDGEEEAKLVRQVVGAVGGELPKGPSPFRSGEFAHRSFTRAVLYRPLVYHTGPSDVAGKLRQVETEIKQSMARPGKGWVNDVVLVYFQGRDRVGKDGVRRLATSQTRQYEEGAGEHTELRVDALERTPGVRLIVLNVAGPGAAQASADPLTADPLQLRYPWKNPAATGELLPLYGEAVGQEQSLGGVVDRVRDAVRKNTARADDPIDALPPEVRDRPFGPVRP
jgi:hypothetical protein